jgi:hypothetical protein
VIRTARGRFPIFSCLLAAGVLLTGCASEPLPDPAIPSDRAERDAWVALAAQTNGVHMDRTQIAILTGVICKDLPHRDDVEDLAEELSRLQDVEKQEARIMTTLSVYAYCPEFKSKLKKGNFKTVAGTKIYLD